MLLSTAVAAKTFSTTKWREGYDQGQVDAYLERIGEALAAWERRTVLGVSPAITGDEVVSVRFSPTKFRAGYDQGEVDDFLDQVTSALREHESATR